MFGMIDLCFYLFCDFFIMWLLLSVFVRICVSMDKFGVYLKYIELLNLREKERVR